MSHDAVSSKALALAELGADVVEADLVDEGSLRAAFDGAHGAFLRADRGDARRGAR